MKHHFVRTENHRRFMSIISLLEGRGSSERCIGLITGDPGVGKTRTVDNWGSDVDAVLLEGISGMNLRYIKDALKHETGVTERGNFEMLKALVKHFKESGAPIILDEAHHGLALKAECIEYLRRLAEKAEVMLILVCHTSEKHRFNKPGLEHISTRIGGICELQKPTIEDTAIFVRELCEVEVAPDLIAEIHKQSAARYRLIGDAVANIERIAAKMGKTTLQAADVSGFALCQDWEKSLKYKGAR